MTNFITVFVLLIFGNCYAQTIDVTEFGAKPNSFEDATSSVREAIETAANNQQTIINFPKGRYDFWPDSAIETSYYISNSTSETEFPTKRQKVGLLFKGLKNVTLEGNGSTFVFHGKMITWVIDSSENVTIQNLKVDYERPGMSELTVKEITPTSVITTVHPDSKYAIINGQLQWYGEKWRARKEGFFAALVKPTEGTLFYSSWLPFYNSTAEEIAPFTVRFTGDFKTFKAVPGEILTVRDAIRDYVGVFHNRSKDINLRNVNMYAMHGLGIVSQFCENLNYDSVFIEPKSDGGRVIASSADGMHFSGCRGQITINRCHFNGLHDDPVNVHGTHLKVSQIISPTSVKLRFMHPQSYGFLPFVQGDSVAFLNSKSLRIFSHGIVKSAKLISEREVLVDMRKPFSGELKVGDALENITWTPALTIQNSRFAGTISRGTLVTTRRKVMIENNEYYRTGMHAILIENDASGWYESGPVQDVTIHNNRFIECGHNSLPRNYVISINPHTEQVNKGYYVHKNIKIENNYFKVYSDPVLWAFSTRNLTFANNIIERSDFMIAGGSQSAIRLKCCTEVKVLNNQFATQSVVQTELMEERDIQSDITPNAAN